LIETSTGNRIGRRRQPYRCRKVLEKISET